MYEIIRNLADMTANLINAFFDLEIETEAGQVVAFGKISLAFIFFLVTLYLILDALGILDRE